MVDWQFISEAAKSLCEDAGLSDQNERAILWYRLQAEIIAPNAPRIAKFAQAHAALRLLDSIETKSHLGSSAPFAQRLALPGYERIVSNLLSEIGGWRKLGAAFSRATLANDLSARWTDARDAARIVEFSYRFDQTVNSPRKAGVTMGREFVVLAFEISDGTTKTRWKEYGDWLFCD